jgi:hypothetical protein
VTLSSTSDQAVPVQMDIQAHMRRMWLSSPALCFVGAHAHLLAKLSEVTVHLFLALEKFGDGSAEK